MESLILSFEAVAPIFILMLLGYFLKRIKLAEKQHFDAMNKLVFKVFLPVLLFNNVYNTEVSGIIDPKLITYTVIGVFVVFILGYIAVLLLAGKNSIRGAMLQGFFRSNFAILGLPLIDSICKGSSGGLTSFMVAIVVPLFNVLAVVALERFKEGNDRLDIVKLIKGVLSNPLIIGCAIGLVFLFAGIKLPFVIEKSLKDIGSIATPLAIIVLGAGFEFSAIKGMAFEIATVVIVRLIVVPLIAIIPAVFLGFRGEALACILIAFGSAVAVSSYAMAKQMGSDESLTAQVIVFSSIFCMFTLFGWIFVLNYMNLF